MSTIKLPELPVSPESVYFEGDGDSTGELVPMYSGIQMRAYAEEAVLQALAEAAEICAEEGREWDSDGVILYKNYAEHCAQRIRALCLEPRDG